MIKTLLSDFKESPDNFICIVKSPPEITCKQLDLSRINKNYIEISIEASMTTFIWKKTLKDLTGKSKYWTTELAKHTPTSTPSMFTMILQTKNSQLNRCSRYNNIIGYIAIASF